MILIRSPTRLSPSPHLTPKILRRRKGPTVSAKMKKCKLDARREQWLSHVKNKGECKEEVKCEGTTHGGLIDLVNKNMPTEKLEISLRGEQGLYVDGLSIHHFRDSDSLPSNSPTSSVLATMILASILLPVVKAAVVGAVIVVLMAAFVVS